MYMYMYTHTQKKTHTHARARAHTHTHTDFGHCQTLGRDARGIASEGDVVESG